MKGAVRDKIMVLPDIAGIFSPATTVEEGFHQNTIACSFAAEGGTFTMGFVCDGFSKPKTLLRGKKLNPNRTGAMELVLRRKRGAEKFDQIIVGNNEVLKKYAVKISALLSADLLAVIAPEQSENSSRERTDVTLVEQTKFDLLVSLVKESHLTAEVAASTMQISVEEFNARMNTNSGTE